MAQQVKDLVVSLLWLWLLLWYGFNLWPKSLHMLQVQPKIIFFSFFFFLGPHPWHMEGPRLGVQSELQLLAYARATATPDLS